jgi:hypothetical protein
VPRDFLLKTGLKSEFGSVEPDLSVAKSNWAYAVSSDILLASASTAAATGGGAFKDAPLLAELVAAVLLCNSSDCRGGGSGDAVF